MSAAPILFFELNGLVSRCAAWRMTNLLDLVKPATKRGTTRLVMPGADGARVFPLHRDASERVIIGQVFGARNPDGVPYMSEIEGLIANLGLITDAWGTIPSSTNSLLPLVLHLPNGVTKSGDVQIADLDWDHESMPIVANVIMRLVIPAGQLA
jgi:hypothetical protein